MIQDLDYGKLDNQYKNITPTPNDIVVCIQKNTMLVCRDENNHLSLPTWKEVQTWAAEWNQWLEAPLTYAFNLQDRNYFLWLGEAGECPDNKHAYEPASTLRQKESKNICFALMTAWHIYNWYRVNRYCGNCGTPTIHDDKERMMRCPHCNNLIFPRIAPAVLVGITHNDKIVLIQYANRNYKHYGIVAGFIEVGETAEEAVAREVMEEVGLKVKNIRYYKSQPWGVAGNLSLGYFCELDGDDDTITLDENELSMAQWYHRDDIPAEDDDISLTREMVRIFKEGTVV